MKSLCEGIDPSLAEKTPEGTVITEEECKEQLMNIFKSSNATWDYDQMHFDPTTTTHPAHFKVWKSRNSDMSSNWLIAKSIGTVNIGPDTLIIHETTRSWGGLSKNENTIVKQIPHDLTGDDITVLKSFFDSILIKKEIFELKIDDKFDMNSLKWPTGYC